MKEIPLEEEVVRHYVCLDVQKHNQASLLLEGEEYLQSLAPEGATHYRFKTPNVTRVRLTWPGEGYATVRGRDIRSTSLGKGPWDDITIRFYSHDPAGASALLERVRESASRAEKFKKRLRKAREVSEHTLHKPMTI
ncbi:MAG: hypothetical protein ACE5FT_00030 [Candidatus Nanoarchaeia archaeon]